MLFGDFHDFIILKGDDFVSGRFASVAHHLLYLSAAVMGSHIIWQILVNGVKPLLSFALWRPNVRD